MKITKDDIGRRVWCFLYGWGTIEEVNGADMMPYPVEVSFSMGSRSYDIGGRSFIKSNPTLFWDEIRFKEPPKPKRIIKKTIERWVNIYPCQDWIEYAGNEEEANSVAGTNRIACVKLIGEYEIDETEGK